MERIQKSESKFVQLYLRISAYTLMSVFLLIPFENAFADTANPTDPVTWSVTPGSYAYDMTMTAVLYFELNESTDPNDRIAAFAGSDCRGVEYTRTVVGGRYLAYLRIYGNTSSGDTVTLYIYDASENNVVEVVEKVSFVPQANYGTQSSPYKATVAFDVQFTVESDGTPLSNANVSLNGYGQKLTSGAGEVLFSNVPPTASIDFLVEKESYISRSGSLQVNSADVAENVELTLETYDLTVQVTDGTIPLENMSVAINGYGTHQTNVSGIVVVNNVLPATAIGITVSGEHYQQKTATVNVTDSNAFKKITVNPVTYSLNFNVSDPDGAVSNTSISSFVNKLISEDFSSAVVPSQFYTSGQGAWQVTGEEMLVGDYSIRSASVNHNQASEISLNGNFGEGKISFYTKVSSEAVNDRLIFKIDDNVKGIWSGDTPWEFNSYDISGGQHLLTWIYMKDGSTSTGDDCAWLDYITYTSAEPKTDTKVTNGSGEALITGFYPGRKIYLEVKSENHLYFYDEINSLTSDSVFNISLDPVFNVNFVVRSQNHLTEYNVANAIVTLNIPDSVKITDNDGKAGFSRISSGNLPFTISAKNYETYSGSVEVTNADVNTIIEITLLEYETYTLAFEVINGKVPVQGAVVSLYGYGDKTTNVYGKAVFDQILAHVDLTYSVTDADYYTIEGEIEGLADEKVEKCVLVGKTYNLTVKASDSDGFIEGLGVSCIVNEEPDVEDFFTENLPAGFNTYGNGMWFVTADTMLQGEYAVRSAGIYDNQVSVLKMEKHTREGYLSFYYKVSSEKNNDYLLFEIDGEEIERWSGDISWQFFNYKIPEGLHVFEWKYVKDGNLSKGDDCAWIDYIVIPSIDSVIQEAVTDFNGEAVLYNLKSFHSIQIEGSSLIHENYRTSVGDLRSDSTINILLARVYDVAFNITSEDITGNVFVDGAEIMLNGSRTEFTSSYGSTLFTGISIGKHGYSISADGYYDFADSLEVINGDVIETVQMKLIPEFKATSVVTANDDGYNDYWEIYNAGNYAGFTVSIYSSAGVRIFTTSDYPNNKWNGKLGERKLPDGIYYYIVSSPNDDLVFKGIINLIN